MQLINQHTKRIMEECKARARDAGLSFDPETLEYIITNKDMLELSPKIMIPTLYDYWVHDVQVLKEQGKYKLYPSNPYETVINSRPAISFYNDNNPDWMNIMIFYHVLAHIDFFQNNTLFEHTWNDDFVGQALSDKRHLESLRSEHGRWVDYAIEFSRSLDNITGYFYQLSARNIPREILPSRIIEYYFDEFLQETIKLPGYEIIKEIDRYNDLLKQNPQMTDAMFFATIKSKYPEFQAKFEKFLNETKKEPVDLMEFIMEHSPFLKKDENHWMKTIMAIVRHTALYFAPQIRTKISNEGWASHWHDHLFRKDERIKGHEVAYSILNAGVTSLSRIGLNPYAIGLRLFEYVKELADKGKLSREYQQILNTEQRKQYDNKANKGQEAIFDIRKKFSDFMLINTFVNQDFVDRYDLFVVGKRLNQEKGMYEYYVKSRKATDYKKMLLDQLYHPPVIRVVQEKTHEKNLYLKHAFEGKQLIKDFIPDTIMGIEYLWGGQVQLETTEILLQTSNTSKEAEYTYKRVLYTIKDRKISKLDL